MKIDIDEEQIKRWCENILKSHDWVSKDVKMNFNGYMEDAICIEKSKIGYITYRAHNNKKINKKISLTFIDAVKKLLYMCDRSRSGGQVLWMELEAAIWFYKNVERGKILRERRQNS